MQEGQNQLFKFLTQSLGTLWLDVVLSVFPLFFLSVPWPWSHTYWTWILIAGSQLEFTLNLELTLTIKSDQWRSSAHGKGVSSPKSMFHFLFSTYDRYLPVTTRVWTLLQSYGCWVNVLQAHSRTRAKPNKARVGQLPKSYQANIPAPWIILVKLNDWLEIVLQNLAWEQHTTFTGYSWEDTTRNCPELSGYCL